MTAIDLARHFGKKVEAIAVYDPYLHYTVFNGIVERAQRIGRQGLPLRGAEPAARGSDRHRAGADLPVAPRGRREDGGRRRRRDPQDAARRQGLPEGPQPRPQDVALAAGRRPQSAIHSAKDDNELGSNTENLLRNAPCDVLLTTRARDPRARRAGRGVDSLDAGVRGAHEARSGAGAGHRPDRDLPPGGREGAQRHHQRPARRGDGALHAEGRQGEHPARRAAGARPCEREGGVDLQALRHQRGRVESGRAARCAAATRSR